MTTTLHRFHIPVMGLAYTVDSPVKVARFGIASTISIIEDRLIEMMRSYYYPKSGEPYIPITTKEDDYRARRITDYLNLVNRIVNGQVEKLKAAAVGNENLMPLFIECVENNITLGEICNTLRVVWGEYVAEGF